MQWKGQQRERSGGRTVGDNVCTADRVVMTRHRVTSFRPASWRSAIWGLRPRRLSRATAQAMSPLFSASPRLERMSPQSPASQAKDRAPSQAPLRKQRAEAGLFGGRRARDRSTINTPQLRNRAVTFNTIASEQVQPFVSSCLRVPSPPAPIKHPSKPPKDSASGGRQPPVQSQTPTPRPQRLPDNMIRITPIAVFLENHAGLQGPHPCNSPHVTAAA